MPALIWLSCGKARGNSSFAPEDGDRRLTVDRLTALLKCNNPVTCNKAVTVSELHRARIALILLP